MLVSFRCLDGENTQNKRMQALQAHLSWVEQNMNNIKVAGPLLGEDQSHIGSMYILLANSIDAAKQIFKTDPYYTAGIWQQIDITEFKDYAGTWVGGKNWPGAEK